METKAVKQEEVLVLVDDQGGYYAIPRGVLEQYRATEEQKAQIEALRGDDVEGYGTFGAYDLYVQEETLGAMLDDRRQEVARDRMARESRAAERAASKSSAQHQRGSINVIAAFSAWLAAHGSAPGVR